MQMCETNVWCQAILHESVNSTNPIFCINSSMFNPWSFVPLLFTITESISRLHIICVDFFIEALLD